MILRHLLKPVIHRLWLSKSLSTKQNVQKSIQVCVLGASSKMGRFLSFLLKQNPLLSTLHIQGDRSVLNMGVDLSLFDTKCQVKCYYEHEIPKALRTADVVLVLPKEKLGKETPIGERIMAEGKRVYQIAQQCTEFAPRSIIVVCVPPISVMTVIVANVFKNTHFYHPGRIFGSVAKIQVKANTMMGRSQDLDPRICYVPITGGPDADLAVPVFSKAKPIELTGRSAHKLIAKLRGIKEDKFPKEIGKPNLVLENPMAESHMLNMLVSSIALGICGDDTACGNVYLRSKCVNICKHLVTTVRFSRGGAVHNFDLPYLEPFELQLLEQAAQEIQKREKMADDYVKLMINKGYKTLPKFKQEEDCNQMLQKQKLIR